MAMSQARNQSHGGMVETLNYIFAGEDWREIMRESSLDVRADKTIDLLREIYGARWVSSMRMLGDNRNTRYILAHFTNHEAGRDLMKDCMWAVCPDGGFYARRSDNPKQTMLIEPEPDLEHLEKWLKNQLQREPFRWSTSSQRIRNELWRNVHLSQIIRKHYRDGTIVASEFTGRFSEKADPLLSLSTKKGQSYGRR